MKEDLVKCLRVTNNQLTEVWINIIKCFHQILLISGGNWGENWCWRRRIFCCYYAGWLNCLNLVLNYQNRKLHKPKNSWQELKIGENTLLLFRFFLSQIWIVLIRHKDIKRLEEGITEIHSMFMDLAILVEQQGEMVTRIEDHINSEQIILTLPTLFPWCLFGTRANNSDFIKPGSRENVFSCCYWCGKGTR